MKAWIAVALTLLAMQAGPAHAQFISPGHLAGPHASLEGIRNCTQCHELGRKGASDARCLACHTPVAARIRAGTGLHATTSEPCASCHKDHFGRTFALVRMDTAAFDHASVGFALDGAHGAARCDDCHSAGRVAAADVRAWAARHGTGADRTLLGLSAECAACHAPDDPHGTQFGDRACGTCHGARSFEGAERFDHARTAYPLKGRHRTASCDGCHRADAAGVIGYARVSAGTCAGCHTDAHAGAMGGDCASCHSVDGWAAVARSAVEGRFDHARTGYVLEGAHAAATCAACHGRAPRRTASLDVRHVAGGGNRAYPAPVTSGGCVACHTDYHARADASVAPSCDGCHTQAAWSPGLFDLDRHAGVPAFPLTGAHVAVPCVECHGRTADGRTSLHPATACEACHAERDPHAGRFGARVACADCHVTGAWDAARMDHARLDAGATCASCHGAADPHGDQFGGRSCDACHATTSFRIPAFDHAATAFVLDGAHASVPCAGCHGAEPAGGGVRVRYRPTPTACAACHAGDDA